MMGSQLRTPGGGVLPLKEGASYLLRAMFKGSIGVSVDAGAAAAIFAVTRLRTKVN